MNREWHLIEGKALTRMNNRCFIGGALLGFGVALVTPLVRLVHHAVDKTIRDDIRKEILAEEEEE